MPVVDFWQSTKTDRKVAGGKNANANTYSVRRDRASQNESSKGSASTLLPLHTADSDVCWRLGSDPGGNRAGEQVSKDNVASTTTLKQFSFSTALRLCADAQVLLSIWFIFSGYKKYKKKNFTDGKLNTKVKLTKKRK